MRLSEAIRLGAMQGPQLRGRSFGPEHASCALGAACIAVGRDDINDLYRLYKINKQVHVSRLGVHKLPLSTAIVYLNDYARWTREQIADWIVANNLDCDSVILTQQEEHEHQADLVTA